MDLVNSALYSNPLIIPATRNLGLRPLKVLTIQDLPGSSFGALLNHWQSNPEPGFIDMSYPKELLVYVATFKLKDLSLVQDILQTRQETIETLRIHTWGLQLGITYYPPNTPMGYPVVLPPYGTIQSTQLPV